MIKKFAKKVHSLYRLRSIRKINSIGSHCSIGRGVTLNNCVLSDHSRIAERASVHFTSIGGYSSIGRYAKITHAEIGKFCAISWDTTINAISHPFHNLSISAFPYAPRLGNFVKTKTQTYQKVIIGNDVWIGANSVIMPGIKIGNGAVIGAGAVVTKNVPDYAIVVGVPSKVIKYRFSDDIVTKLLDLEWWNLDRETIVENIELWKGEFDEITLNKLESLCNY